MEEKTFADFEAFNKTLAASNAGYSKNAADDAPGLRFKRNKDGSIYKDVYANIELALEKLNLQVRKNEFKLCLEVKGVISGDPHDGEINDDIATRIRYAIDEEFHFLPSKGVFLDVISDIGFVNSYHPLKDYLGSLSWDGKPRIDTFLSAYGGAENNELNRAFSHIWFVAAVRRVMEPGCKFDTLLMTESSQGKNKSTALEILAVKPEWFTDSLHLGADAKVVIEQTQGVWIVEFPEMTGIRKDVERIKAFASQRVDRSRLAYGHFAITAPRQWIGCISKNQGARLLDDENRRFWPVEITLFDIDAIRTDRDQLWAEAVVAEKEGQSLFLDRSLWADAAEVQKGQRVENPFEEELNRNLMLRLPNPGLVPLGDLDNRPVWVAAADVWLALDVHAVADRVPLQNMMGAAMIRLGFSRKTMKGREHESLHRDCSYYVRGAVNRELIAGERLEAEFKGCSPKIGARVFPVPQSVPQVSN